MKPDDFERKLQRQPLRQAPAAWRAEILDAARAAGSRRPAFDSRQVGWFSTLGRQLSAVLWPSPKAWGALMATWLVIFVVQFSVRDRPAMAAQRTAVASPDVMIALRQQKRLLAELIGRPARPEAEQRQPLLLRPRSGRCEEWLKA